MPRLRSGPTYRGAYLGGSRATRTTRSAALLHQALTYVHQSRIYADQGDLSSALRRARKAEAILVEAISTMGGRGVTTEQRITNRWLTVSQAAKEAGITPRAITAAIRRGTLTAAELDTPSGRVRFMIDREVFAAWRDKIAERRPAADQGS